MPPKPIIGDSLHRIATEKRSGLKDARKTTRLTIGILCGVVGIDLLRANARNLTGNGPSVPSYIFETYGRILASPLDLLLVLSAVGALAYFIHAFRHRNDPADYPLPPYPPLPDLRNSDDIYIGSGHTYDGRQPGDMVPPETELLDEPHLIWKAKGQFGNGHVIGGIGSGKTEALIKPVLFGLITKHPKPPLPPHMQAMNSEAAHEERARKRERKAFERSFDWLRARPGLKWAADDGELKEPSWASSLLSQASTCLKKDGLTTAGAKLQAAADMTQIMESVDIYEGMTPEDAEAKFNELMANHKTRKCGLMMVDMKGDLAEFVLRVATLAGRADDVVILKPGGQWTYNPFLLSSKSLTMAEIVMDGVDAVAEGPQGPSFWRSTQGEWLTNAISILRAVSPNKCTFAEILRMAREDQLRAWYVGQAERLRTEQVQEEHRLHSLGLEYNGVRVDQGAIDFFKDFDSEEADPTMQRAVVQGIKAFAKYYVEPELKSFLNPELPPTFPGFRECFDKGKLVVLHMPQSDFGPVGRVLGILTMSDFMQVARRRVTDRTMNQERLVYLIVDEVQNYLSTPLKEFLAINRQSRVCCLFAHQSLGQLMKGSNEGYLVSFTDNCRTKFVFQATNGKSGAELSKLLGQRPTERITQNITASLPAAALKNADAGGGTVGESFSAQEIEKSWFTAHDLFELKTGETVVLAFDGDGNNPPRKVKAPLFYMTHGSVMAPVADLVPETEAPHPVVWIEGQSAQDEDYLNLFTAASRYFIIHPLLKKDGGLGGIRMTAPEGTLIIDYDTLIEQRDTIAGHLSEETMKVGIPDAGAGMALFWRILEIPLNAPVFLDAAWTALGDGKRVSTWDLLEQKYGVARAWPELGGWEAFLSRQEGLRAHIQAESRALLKLYRLTVEEILGQGEDQFGLLVDTFRREAEAALPDAEASFQAEIEADENDELDDAGRAGLAIRLAADFFPTAQLVHEAGDDSIDVSADQENGDESTPSAHSGVGDDDELAVGFEHNQPAEPTDPLEGASPSSSETDDDDERGADKSDILTDLSQGLT